MRLQLFGLSLPFFSIVVCVFLCVWQALIATAEDVFVEKLPLSFHIQISSEDQTQVTEFSPVHGTILYLLLVCQGTSTLSSSYSQNVPRPVDQEPSPPASVNIAYSFPLTILNKSYNHTTISLKKKMKGKLLDYTNVFRNHIFPMEKIAKCIQHSYDILVKK